MGSNLPEELLSSLSQCTDRCVALYRHGASAEGDGSKRDQVISISDRLLPWEVNKNPNGAKDYFPGENANYRAARDAFGLETIHFGEDVRASENMEFISQVPIYTPPEFNTSCAHTLLDSVAFADAHLYFVRRALSTTRSASWARTAAGTPTRPASSS